jgi:hypothetical protein
MAYELQTSQTIQTIRQMQNHVDHFCEPGGSAKADVSEGNSWKTRLREVLERISHGVLVWQYGALILPSMPEVYPVEKPDTGKSTTSPFNQSVESTVTK